MSSNKDVLAMDEKDERLLITKVLRDWAKLNKTNQFDMALKLISTLYRGFSVQYNFISDKSLQDDFQEYFLALDGDYDTMIKVISDFAENVENKIIPRFGV